MVFHSDGNSYTPPVFPSQYILINILYFHNFKKISTTW